MSEEVRQLRIKYEQLKTDTQEAVHDCEKAKIAWQNAIDKKRRFEESLMKVQEDLMMAEYVETQQEAISKAKIWVPKTPMYLKTPGKLLKALDATIEVDDEEIVVDLQCSHNQIFHLIEYYSVKTGKHVLLWINVLDQQISK